MSRLSFCICLLHVAALGTWISCASTAAAQGPNRGGDRPVYQRHAFESKWRHDDRRRRNFDRNIWVPPQVNSGWFQRPYPYHLDYYKMRYGGSYAPYFGNLYGPPEVVTAPPYYGSYFNEFIQPGGQQYPVQYPPGDVYAEPNELPAP